MKRLGELLAYTVFAAVVGVLSVWPSYSFIDEKEAIISLTFSHAAQRIGECRRLTQEELNKLPPNMRKPADCPRERHPVRIELRSNDKILFSKTLMPSGIWSDGKANVYARVVVPTGEHAIFVGMNESGGSQGFDFQGTANVDIVPGQNVVVRFEEDLQAFSIR